MSWSSRKEGFRKVVKLYRGSQTGGFNGIPEYENKEADKFLANLDELKAFLSAPSSSSSNDAFWKGFLDAAINAADPNCPPENKKTLNNYVLRLEQETLKHSRKLRIRAGTKISIGAFFGLGGAAVAITGTMLFEGVIAGAIAAALGTGGALGLGIGLAIVGLIIAAIAVYEMSKNWNLYQNKQLEEIKTYIKTLAGKPEGTFANLPPALPGLILFDPEEDEQINQANLTASKR